MSIMLILNEFQGQVTKGHDKQRSDLSSMTHVAGTILAIEFDSGIPSIARNIFFNLM